MQKTSQLIDDNASNLGEINPAAPKVLLVENSGWSVVAMLAVRLANAGIQVSAVCPAHNLLHKTRAVRELLPYSAVRPLESLSAAIKATRPDLIIPCDDRAVGHAHELHARSHVMGVSGRMLSALIEKSLGSPESYRIVSSRYDLIRIAREEGLRVPDTAQVNSESDLAAWEERHVFPCVLKADTTGNGRGVRIAHSPGQAGPLLAELTRFYRLGRAVKRLCVNRDPFWLRPWWNAVKPAVIAQSYIQGSPATCGVLCWQGKVLAAIGVEVVSETEAMAHSSVVRVVDNPDMMLCAERIARRLNLSGFFGLDFMIEEGTNLTYLIEMNPRPTRLSSLRLGKGRDMIGALLAQLCGSPPQEVAVTQKDKIAYFPEIRDPNSKSIQSCYYDIPEGEPELMQELRQPWLTTTHLWRMAKLADQMKMYLRNHLFKRKSVQGELALQRNGRPFRHAQYRD